MLATNRTSIEAEINGRTFRLDCHVDAPLGDVMLAIDKYREYIQEIIDRNSTEKIEKEEDEEELWPIQTN